MSSAEFAAPEPMPLISVLIPAYNHAHLVRETVAGIWSQTGVNLEIILIDDGSRDDTFAVAQGLQPESPFPMQVLRQANSGLNRTLNRALALAKGEYVALVASDDVYCERRFDAQLACFRANPNLKLAIGNGRYWRPPHVLRTRVVSPAAAALLSAGDAAAVLNALYTNEIHIATTACLYKRELLEQVGGWDTSVVLDDWVLNVRLFRTFQTPSDFCYVDEDLFLYRLHGSSTVSNVSRLLNISVEAAQAYVPPPLLARSRANLYWSAGQRLLGQGNLAGAARYFWQSQATDFDLRRVAELASKGLIKLSEAQKRGRG